MCRSGSKFGIRISICCLPSTDIQLIHPRPLLHQSHFTYVLLFKNSLLAVLTRREWSTDVWVSIPFQRRYILAETTMAHSYHNEYRTGGDFESSRDNQRGLSPWNAIFAERGVQRRSSQKFVVSKIVCYVIIKLKSNGSSFTIRIAE